MYYYENKSDQKRRVEKESDVLINFPNKNKIIQTTGTKKCVNLIRRF